MSQRCASPYCNRQNFSIKNQFLPYNPPMRPQYFQNSCGQIGAQWTSVAGTFGNCPGSKVCAGMPPYDWICPTSRYCYSQTTDLVGYTPQDICRNIHWARRKSRTCASQCSNCFN
uniref:Uncharacterized protein n=1 Tax=viral metagenome TaxID=1070528 RepID=A0A6C0BQB1_9ZZZZ